LRSTCWIKLNASGAAGGEDGGEEGGCGGGGDGGGGGGGGDGDGGSGGGDGKGRDGGGGGKGGGRGEDGDELNGGGYGEGVSGDANGGGSGGDVGGRDGGPEGGVKWSPSSSRISVPDGDTDGGGSSTCAGCGGGGDGREEAGGGDDVTTGQKTALPTALEMAWNCLPASQKNIAAPAPGEVSPAVNSCNSAELISRDPLGKLSRSRHRPRLGATRPARATTVVTMPGTSMRIPSDTSRQSDQAGISHARKPKVVGGNTSPASPCIMITSSWVAICPLTVLAHPLVEQANPFPKSVPELTVPVTKPRLGAISPGSTLTEHFGRKDTDGNGDGNGYGEGVGIGYVDGDGDGDGVGLLLTCAQYLSASSPQ